jgi:hypothetical protein
LVIGLIVTSCSNDNGTSQEQEAQNLEKMHAKFCPLQSVNNVRIQLGPLLNGSKACGGPTGFIAYSLKLNTTDFLDKVGEIHKFPKRIQ